MALKDRLNILFQSQKLGQKEFAAKIDIAQSTLNNYLNGVSEPNFSNIMSILIAFENINANWLLRGEGMMYLNEDLSKFGSIKNLIQKNDIVSEPEGEYKNAPTPNPQPPTAPLRISDLEYLQKAVEMLQVENIKLRERVERLERNEK